MSESLLKRAVELKKILHFFVVSVVFSTFYSLVFDIEQFAGQEYVAKVMKLDSKGRC